jgi:subfamily B ATP-binding cassette protein MsbA
MNYIKKLIPFALPYKRYAYLNIFFNILYALFSTLSFVALIPVFKVIFSDQRVVTEKPKWQGWFELQKYGEDYLNYIIVDSIEKYGDFKVLMIMVSVIIGMFLLKNLSNYFAMYFITFLRNGVLKDLRNKLYDKIISLPLAFYSEKSKGDTIARVSSDVDEVRNSFLAILEMIIREPLTILFSLITMLILSLKLTVFVLIFIPLSGFLISRIGKSLKKGSLNVQNEQGVFLSVLEETMTGLRIIKAFNVEKMFANKFEHSNDRFYKYSNSLLNRQNLASPLSELLGIIVIGILLVYGGYLVFIDQTMDASFFVGYITLAYNILTPAKAISKASYSVKRGDGAANRILEFLETEVSIQEAENPIEKTSFDKELTIENVSFKYEDEFVLKNFSLNISKGKAVALVGQSGSGKSTIANLVTRFYDVNEGSISIDGINIKDLSKKSLRDFLGLVNQDSILFNDTIANNLKVGKETASEEEMIEALKVANAWEFVKDLPKGIHTNIGDGGGKISGGQKQRINIARAVLKNPPIMILDEATSALDTESERLVQDALENMMKNRTSIVIAHRLSTIQNADLIVVMHKGEIAEHGTHTELLKKQGIYKKLVEMQSFDS